MSQKSKRKRGTSSPLPPVPAREGEPAPEPRRSGVEVMSIKEDRLALKAQDQTIQDMADRGYEHYETFGVTGQEVVLRFRRRVEA